jgi:hypothetical protein
VETTTTKLTTAVEVLAAFNAVANDAELNKNPESAELLKDLAQIFIHRPIGEIVGALANNADAVHVAFEKLVNLYPDGSQGRRNLLGKQLLLVDDFVKAGTLDEANTWLVICYRVYPYGSEEVKAIVAKGVSLVGEFVKAGNFDTGNAWLERGYRVYPSGSEESTAIVAKRLSLVDEFIKADKLDYANDWLATGLHLYPSGSVEEKDVAAKQEQLRQLRSSEQMGASPRIDFTGLRTVVKQELAKLQVASVGH